MAREIGRAFVAALGVTLYMLALFLLTGCRGLERFAP